jgi:hypothetical protein
MAAPTKALTPEQAEPLIRAAVTGKGTFSLGQIADAVGAPTMQVFSVLEKMVTEGKLRRLTSGGSGAASLPAAAAKRPVPAMAGAAR